MEFTPPSSWPVWARWAGSQRAGSEVGIGDTVERLLGSGGAKTKAALLRLGIDCGCCDRRTRMNERYPYPPRSFDGQ